MKRIFIMIIILPLVLSGCWDQRIFEKIDFILNLGIESSNDGKLMVTYTSPAIGPGKKPSDVQLITTTGSILRDARGNARTRSTRLLEAGKIQQVLISAELAQKRSVHEMLEVLERDPIDPTQAWVVVVDGSPNELLQATTKFKDKPRASIYINQLLDDSAASSNIPRTQVYDFDINYFAPGVDPMTPLINFTDKEIRVTGSALFSGGLMVGRINHSHTFFILAARGTAESSGFSAVYPFPPDVHGGVKDNMVVNLVNNKRRINVSIKDNKPVISISLNFGGSVQEYVWNNLSSEKEQQDLEKYIEGLLKKDCEEVLKYTQKVGSDPIGIGDMVRAKYSSYWKSVEWKDVYKDAVFNVDVTMDIKQYGNID